MLERFLDNFWKELWLRLRWKEPLNVVSSVAPLLSVFQLLGFFRAPVYDN